MAAEDSITSQVKRQELEDATSCCICTDVYKEPKLLPCTHTFCMKCIQETGLKTDKGPGDEMPCPICRRLFKIPPEGFHGLPNNSFVAKLIQVESISDQSALSDVCDACLEENEGETSEEIPVADAYCVECRQKLCEECCTHHRKVKLTKNHKLVPIKELHQSNESVISNLASSVCELHEQKVLDVFCVKCNEVVCAICFIDDHRNHEGSHVSKYVTDFRQQIESHLKSMSDSSSQAQLVKLELIKMKTDIQQKVESLQSDVVNRRDEIKQLADANAHSILQGMGVLQRNKLKEIEVASGEVDAYLSIIDSFKANCQNVITLEIASHICQSFSKLSARAAELQLQGRSLANQEIESFRVSFKKSELEEFLQNESGNLIGEIEEECHLRPKETSKREQLTIKVGQLEVISEKLQQDLNSEKTTNKALQAEVMKLRQELNKEKKSNETLQVDLGILKQKIVNERKSAKEELEKTQKDFQCMNSKLQREKKKTEQLVVNAQKERKLLAELRYKSNPVLVDGMGTRSSEKRNKRIRGLAILDEELYVASDGSSEIEVYDLLKLSFSRRWILKDIMYPADMTSCNRNKCLYIIDIKGTNQSKEILRVDPSGRLIKNWSTGDDWGWALSVTDESNVILTIHIKNKLNEYSPDGQLIREINLSSEAGIRYPLCAIKLANGDFLVSHGRLDGELHRVCVIDADVKLKKSFGGKPGLSTRNICDPAYLAIDGNGFVLVADRGNGRVLLLDSDLNCKREILSKKKHGLVRPHGIFLDEANGRLFLIESEDAFISIFDF